MMTLYTCSIAWQIDIKSVTSLIPALDDDEHNVRVLLWRDIITHNGYKKNCEWCLV